MTIVTALEGFNGIEWETRSSFTLYFASRRRQLHALRGLMVLEYYLDFHDDTGQIGITGFRCTSCGEVIDPVILRSRLNPIPSLVHVVKQRKYAQRVDQSESDGHNQKGHGNDRAPGD